MGNVKKVSEMSEQEYQEQYRIMFERFHNDGFFYQPVTDDVITFRPNYSTLLYPYEQFRDIGTKYCLTYNGEQFNVYFYCADIAVVNETNEIVAPAPLFDHGLSLLFSCNSKEDILRSDVLKDFRIQCCVGSDSAKENLNLIPEDKLPELNGLKETDREYIFDGIDDIMPDYWCDKIWEFIWERWKYYEEFCNKR